MSYTVGGWARLAGWKAIVLTHRFCGRAQFTKRGSKTLSASALMQDFRAFVLKYFDQRIVEKEFLEHIKDITNDFRNKAAHPYLMEKKMADKCLLLVRMTLSELLDSYRMD